MTKELDEIVRNARTGKGQCRGCPAQAEHSGEFVNPGLLNYDAEVMFLTLDPSHRIDWDKYDSWSEYNQEYSRRFASWRGGKKIAELVEPLNMTLEDVWLGDTIKCPVDNSLYRFDDSAKIESAFDHCQSYLQQEVETVDPAVIVALGEDAAKRTLDLVFDRSIGELRTGTADCGRVFDTEPPVVASPHWSHGWLDRTPTGTRNLERVQDALVDVYNSRSV